MQERWERRWGSHRNRKIIEKQTDEDGDRVTKSIKRLERERREKEKKKSQTKHIFVIWKENNMVANPATVWYGLEEMPSNMDSSTSFLHPYCGCWQTIRSFKNNFPFTSMQGNNRDNSRFLPIQSLHVGVNWSEWKVGKQKCRSAEEAADVNLTKPKWPGVLGASQPRKPRHRPKCEHTELPLPQPPPSLSFIFPGLALTATWASFHSGLGCGARSWETLTAGPVSQNKAWVLDREGERGRET